MDEKTFLKLCKKFIDYKRMTEKGDGYCNNNDLDVLYRLLNNVMHDCDGYIKYLNR